MSGTEEAGCYFNKYTNWYKQSIQSNMNAVPLKGVIVACNELVFHSLTTLKETEVRKMEVSIA